MNGFQTRQKSVISDDKNHDDLFHSANQQLTTRAVRTIIADSILFGAMLSRKCGQTRGSHFSRSNLECKGVSWIQTTRCPDHREGTRRPSYSSVFKPCLYMTHTLRSTSNSADPTETSPQLADSLRTARDNIWSWNIIWYYIITIMTTIISSNSSSSSNSVLIH
jgi:hypothetical protein